MPAPLTASRVAGLCLILAASSLAAEPAPGSPALTAAEARRQITALTPRGQRLLTSQGATHVVLQDLDGDGQPEAFAVSLQGPASAAESTEELARFGRLFEPEGTELRFTLLVFADQEARLSLVRSVDLGPWRVLAGMDIRRISRDLPYPFALSFVFQTLEGAEHVWVVIPRDPRAAPAQAVFHETLSSDVSVLDVDGDGVLDVVTSERELERSGLTETYLAWYRWSGGGFREQASTILLRNLLQFLSKTRTQLLDRAYDELVRDALEPGAVLRFRRAGLGSQAIIARFFPSAPELDSIRDLVLPTIRSSPFRLPSEAPASVPLQVRVVDALGVAHFVQIVLAVARNPFQPRQFSLLPTEALD